MHVLNGIVRSHLILSERDCALCRTILTITHLLECSRLKRLNITPESFDELGRFGPRNCELVRT
jgi:hypothetical protein